MIEAPAPSAPRSFLRALWRARGASLTLVMAAALAPAAVTIGAGIDYARAYSVAVKLQSAADAGALAAVRARQASHSTADAVRTVAAAQVRDRLSAELSTEPALASATIAVTGKDDPKAATVTLRAAVETTLLRAIGIDVLNVTASSVAEAS